MANASAPLTLWDAIAFLGPLIGTGGLAAILVAYFGSKKPSSPAASPTAAVAHGIQALLADHMAMAQLSAEIKRVADSSEDVAKAINRACDLIDIAQAVERLRKD